MTPSWRALLPVAALMALAGCHYARFENRPLSPSASAQGLAERTLRDADLQAFLRANFDPGFDSTTSRWTFDALCWVAFYYNPTLATARATWGTVQAKAVGARARPNPTLTLAPGLSTNAPGGVPPWIPVVTVDFPIETAGKRRHRMAAAEFEAESSRLAVFTAVWRVRSDLRKALLELSLAETRVEGLQRQEAAQMTVLASYEARQRAGALAAGDVAPARLALVRIHSSLADARRQPEIARQNLAVLLGLSAPSLVGLTFSTAATEVAALPAVELAQLRHRALTSRPDVLGALARYDAAQAGLALEIAKQYPDLHVGPSYQYDEGQSKWTLGFTAEIPIFNHNQAGVAEATARRDEAAAQFLEVQALAIAEIDGAIASWRAVQTQLRSLEQLAAELTTERERTETRRAAGAIDRLEVATANVEFVTADSSRREAQLQAALAGGLLEDALQTPFPHYGSAAVVPPPPSRQ